MDSDGPTMLNQGTGTAAIVMGGDGLWPRGDGTGVPCQAAPVCAVDGAVVRGFIKVTIAALREELIANCQSDVTVQTA
jgi:hypothetical protein